MKTTKHFNQSEKRTVFYKTQCRLEKSITNGRFAQLSSLKKRQLLQRLARYAKQLDLALKPSLVAAFMAAGIFLNTKLQAQSFTLQTGANNPLNGKAVAGDSKPCFADIDGDGDLDIYIGQTYANATVFINSGSISSPLFASQTQFRYTAEMDAAPAFVDIDGDGDLDLFMGQDSGPIVFYKNTGTASAAVFPTYPEGNTVLNPLNGINGGSYSTPVFVDIDTDGDKDLFIGNGAGNILYYKNTGTASSPVFTLQSGASNPFNGVDVGSNAAPAFRDLDGDGDMDAAIGNSAGNILYYKNTGTSLSPAFSQQTGALNPFNAVSVGSMAAPFFADIDHDGNVDLFVGQGSGAVSYFKNTTVVLPMRWLNFTAQQQANSEVLLSWSTANELNTHDFTIECSNDGVSWKALATIPAANSNTSTKNYTYKHLLVNGSRQYYRILESSMDGRTSYSRIIVVKYNGAENQFTINRTALSTGNLVITASNACMLQCYNSSGQVLVRRRLVTGTQSISIKNFAKGVYYLQTQNQIEKIVIE